MILANEKIELDNKLAEWLPGTGTWKICWRGTEHGWAAPTFHEKCNEKKTSLVIVKVVKGGKSLIFGGYCTGTWTGKSVQQATKPLLEKIEALEAELTNVRVQANKNEQYSRKYSLRIVGLNENDGENCVGEVIKLCKEKLNVNVDERDIDRAHRLGPKALSGR
ncbi:Hypothetical predicted protein [Paramuricea clavata]|uniref:TLDc domain-containing protein n=1 Tax=Paramuricea clavata TaxID=317549 RepID=A0A6S7HQE7_PARCT|nr:Hypothetical predicted protein [Paramuricea clavata]